MTDKEKLIKIKELADAMYAKMQYLTTDTSGIRKAMEEYHQFLIYEYYKEEPVSEELEEAGKEWLRPQFDKTYANYGEVKMMELTRFDGYAMLDAIEFGAQWQKEKMMKDAFERTVKVDAGGYPYIDATELYDYDGDKPLAKDGEKVKLIIVKE